MGDLKPLGSEKLQGDDKLKRILELAYYNNNTNNKPRRSSQNAEYIVETTIGAYGIVKEKDGYYVKKGLNENTLDYIGGLFMKNKNRFNSYAEALKRLDLLKGQDLQEATKYVLKKGGSAQPPADAAMDAPPPPAPELPAAPPSDMPPADDVPPSDEMPQMDVPSDAPEADAAPAPDASQGEEKQTKRSDYMSEIQRSVGKLGQSLRDVKEKLESDDIKYVINMVLSAIDMEKLDAEDREDIADRFVLDDEVADDEAGGEMEDDTEVEPEMTDDVPAEPEVEPTGDGDLDENIGKLSEFINSHVGDAQESIAYGQYSDLTGSDVHEQDDDLESHYEDRTHLPDDDFGYEGGEDLEDEKDFESNDDSDLDIEKSDNSDFSYDGEDDDEVVEFDLDEIKNDINEKINSTLSKYFK